MLVRFVDAACALHGKPVEDADCWGFYAKWGMNSDEFWAPIAAAGASWWANLEPYPWFNELVDLVSAADPDFLICTTPSVHHSAAASSCAGKMDWLHANFGKNFLRYDMTVDKSRLSQPGRLLIDDGDHNCIAWRKRKGDFICFPQVWNSNAEHIHRRMDHVREFLKSYRKPADHDQT